jgi:polysaccharide biosynthesis PFTS motif protein
MIKAKNKNWIIFFRLHPINFPLAWLVSLFRPVAYWKIYKILPYFSKRFYQLDPGLFFETGQMEWNAITSDAYDEFASLLPDDWKDLRLNAKFDNLIIDLTSVSLVEFSDEYEAYYQFYFLLRKWKEANSNIHDLRIVNSAFLKDSNILKMPLPKFDIKIVFNFAASLDRIMIALKRLLIIFKACKPAFTFNKSKQIDKNKFTILWHDISFNEMADSSQKFDFSFLVQRNLVNAQDVLYLLPVTPSKEIASRLSKSGINWITSDKFINIVSYSNKWRIVKDLFANTFLYNRINGNKIFRKSANQYLASRAMAYYVLKEYGVKTVIGSSSGHDSGTLNMLANAAGIRTIMWQYAQAGIIPVSYKDNFISRKRLVQSIHLASEVWVWYKADLDLFTQRCLQPSDLRPKFCITGPVMSGDFSWLVKSPYNARIDMNIRRSNKKNLLWVGIFDVATQISKSSKSHRSGPNRFPEDMQVKFFKDIANALDLYPQLHIFFKPKRRTKNDRFFRSEEMINLIGKTSKYVVSGRVIVLDHNIDPHIPIAMSDYCIGAPYTSGVFLANILDRPSVFYDPLNRYKSCYPMKFYDFQLNGSKELYNQIEFWLAGKNPETNETVLRESGIKDPGKEFAAMLLNKL